MSERLSNPEGSETAKGGAADSAATTAAWLRAEIAKTADKERLARLLGESGEIAERTGDEPTAAREYLAAFNADPTFREPLEALVRLLERRRSLKNLGRVIDALVRAAVTPSEKARALLMRAAYLEDVSADVDGAKTAIEEALTEAAAADPPAPEEATAALALELIACRVGDVALRERALELRIKHAGDPTWQALLLIDLARLAEQAGQTDRALELLERAKDLASRATYIAALLAERLSRGEDPARMRLHAAALESLGVLAAEGLTAPERADALGVPGWTRTRAHVADAFLRAADGRRAIGEASAAATLLDRAIELLGTEPDADGLAYGAVLAARMRVAEVLGDTALAGDIAQKRLALETDSGSASALAIRVAELAMSQGDRDKALEALGKATKADPSSLPARALQLDLLAGAGGGAPFAEQLESFAERFGTDAARGRAYLLSAFAWALEADDVAAAKLALSQAQASEVPPGTVARVARAFALVKGDAAWHDEATRRLIASGVDAAELAGLWFELLRARIARGDVDGAKKAVAELANGAESAWFGRVLEAYLPLDDGRPAEGEAAKRDKLGPDGLLALAAHEPSEAAARSLRLLAAFRAHGANDTARAKEILKERLSERKDDAVVAAFLSDLDRKADDPQAAASVLEAFAQSTSDAAAACALALEAGFARWRANDRAGALQAFLLASERGEGASGRAAKMVVGWASRAIDPDAVEGRRVAIERAREGGGDAGVLDLERLATELAAGQSGDAETALRTLEREPEGGALAVAAALARLVLPQASSDRDAVEVALEVVTTQGAPELAAAERVRRAREADPEARAQAARTWVDVGGGAPAAFAWLVSAAETKDLADDVASRRALADALGGEAREQLAAGAAILDRVRIGDDTITTPLLDGDGSSVRLANLELALPGSDPRRRATALCNLGDALGEAAQADALALGGWSLIIAGDTDGAVEVFHAVAQARPDDFAAWEGLRTAAEAGGHRELRAEAALHLGELAGDAQRGAAYFEEAANIYVELGQDAAADAALESAFERDPRRTSAFDRLFRRVRERKDGDRLLALITKRLQNTDDPPEVGKLFWEQARVLRERGDTDGALTALENVVMIEPDHVGALALSGEISIRKGNFADAAERLARLASLDQAPPKNRITAGVAAVDLYENKLDQPARALEVLVMLHRAKLTTLPVRERLAKAAAKTGSWEEATSILEELMTERTDRNGRLDAARLAIAIYRDKLSAPQRAERAVIRALEESPDEPEAVDVLLGIQSPERKRLLAAAQAAIVAKLAQNPTDPEAAARLGWVAQALGNMGLQEAALGLAASLGVKTVALVDAQTRIRAQRGRVVPQTAVTPATLKHLLAPGDDGPIAQLFAILGPTLGEALGPSRDAIGVGRRDRVDPRSGLPLYNEHAAWAGAFGLGEVQLYVGGKDPLGVQGVAGEEPAIVVGSGVRAPFDPATRGRFARELFALSRGTTVLRTRDETTIAAIVVAACRIVDVPIQAPPYAVLAEVEKLISKAIARKTKNAMRETCAIVAQQSPDARMFAHAALLSLSRVALVASGELPTVLVDLVPPAGMGDSRVAALARFLLSQSYSDARRAMGIEAP